MHIYIFVYFSCTLLTCYRLFGLFLFFALSSVATAENKRHFLFCFWKIRTYILFRSSSIIVKILWLPRIFYPHSRARRFTPNINKVRTLGHQRPEFSDNSEIEKQMMRIKIRCSRLDRELYPDPGFCGVRSGFRGSRVLVYTSYLLVTWRGGTLLSILRMMTRFISQ